MKKITQSGALTIGAIATFALLSSQALAFTTISSQLDLGESNSDVTSLQTFLAANPTVYPSGLVTGYFGGLTKAAVLRFQAMYGLGQVGRVGPMTRDKINSLIANGGWSVSSNDFSGPSIYNASQNISTNSATFTWYTDENATAKISYNTSPLMINEGDMNSVGFGATNGYTALNDNVARTSQQVTLTGLMPNTVYYYMIVSTDLSGNISVVGPNNTFRTNAN